MLNRSMIDKTYLRGLPTTCLSVTKVEQPLSSSFGDPIPAPGAIPCFCAEDLGTINPKTDDVYAFVYCIQEVTEVKGVQNV